MLFTKATKQAAIRMVEGEQQHPSPLPDATRKRILNSTIKFYGNTKNKQKDKKGNEAYEVFKGSGVIYMLDANRVYILTAAHNVQLWAIPEDPATNWNNFASLFAKAVTIGYGNRDMSFNSPPTGNADKGKSNAAAPPVLDGCKK
ncbi:MAG TPA: hypothetical protein VJQ56_00765, partial [Blastocatellia bacterium]|nr:hypothetical protein [Blastocatellia bacterium]